MTATSLETPKHEKTPIETKVERQLEALKLEKLKIRLAEKIEQAKARNDRTAAA
jgi:hypothetical protein